MSATIGCQAPDSSTVPWWRGIPARLTTASSLEAEMWRRQHGAPGEGPALPSRVIVGPLGSPGETIVAPDPMVDETDQSKPTPEKLDPKIPAADAENTEDAEPSDDASQTDAADSGDAPQPTPDDDESATEPAIESAKDSD